jgi:uncharacterized membrane protein
MTHCTKCGAALTDGNAFCASCGAPTIAQPPAPIATAATAPAAAGAGLTMNVAAALSYILGVITGVLFLVLEPYKNNRFVRFHAMQSVIFSVACIAFSIVWSIVMGIMESIAGGWLFMIATPVHLLIDLGFFAVWIYLMVQAYQQHEFRLPVIGNIAAKQLG